MVSDFAWGMANAQPVTLSFWAGHSQAGTYSGSIANVAGTRSYPFTYVNNAAWTKYSITIPGDPTGAWVMSGNAASLFVRFDLGSGANFRAPAGAWGSGNYIGVTGTMSPVSVSGFAFNITGVKLEIGSVATPYNRQSLAKSMADCQRYFETGYPIGNSPGTASTNSSMYSMAGLSTAGTFSWGGGSLSFNVTKRAQPTITIYSPVSGASGKIRDFANNVDITGNARDINTGNFTWNGNVIIPSNPIQLGGQWTASAEL